MLVDTMQTPAELRAMRWNETYPVGTPVIALVEGVRVRVRTSSAAWSFNANALVSCRSIDGAIDLRNITPRYECWVRMNRRGAVNHWVQAVWDSEQACIAACEQTKKLDSRIATYDIRTDAPDELTEC